MAQTDDKSQNYFKPLKKLGLKIYPPPFASKIKISQFRNSNNTVFNRNFVINPIKNPGYWRCGPLGAYISKKNQTKNVNFFLSHAMCQVEHSNLETELAQWVKLQSRLHFSFGDILVLVKF